jgi:hypothetical protein
MEILPLTLLMISQHWRNLQLRLRLIQSKIHQLDLIDFADFEDFAVNPNKCPIFNYGPSIVQITCQIAWQIIIKTVQYLEYSTMDHQ